MRNHANPRLTVDAIIERNGSVLMIRRKSDTFGGYLAFPGGFVDYEESVEQAVKREVLEELNLRVELVELLGVYSSKNRDPRGHVVSVVFICTFEESPEAGDDASSYEWLSLNNSDKEELAFDHGKIIEDYKSWKKYNGTYWSSKT
ncbi:MAG: NUDIX domain-containing protein [Candidatus Kariarchaeaceae archaeon]